MSSSSSTQNNIDVEDQTNNDKNDSNDDNEWDIYKNINDDDDRPRNTQKYIDNDNVPTDDDIDPNVNDDVHDNEYNNEYNNNSNNNNNSNDNINNNNNNDNQSSFHDQQVLEKCGEYADLFQKWDFKKQDPPTLSCLEYFNEGLLSLVNFIVVRDDEVSRVSDNCRLTVFNTINFMFQRNHTFPNQRQKRKIQRSIVNTCILSKEIQDTNVLNLSTKFLGNIAFVMSIYIHMILKWKENSKFISVTEESDEVRNEIQIVCTGFVDMCKCFLDTNHKMYEEIELQNGRTMTVYDHLIESFAGNRKISTQNTNGFESLYKVITECHAFYGTNVNIEFCKTVLLASERNKRIRRTGEPGLCGSEFQIATIQPLLLTLSDKICNHFINMAENLLKLEENNVIEQMLHIVGIIHTRIFADKHFDVFLDKQLGVINKLLNSSFLEKRLCAMNYCAKLCNNIENSHNDNSATTEGYMINENDYRYMVDMDPFNVEWQFFNLGDMLNGLAKYNIFQIVFENVFHAEVIKKSGDLIAFHCHLNAVTEKHLTLIWNSMKDKNENERRIVYDCVIHALFNSKRIFHCKNTIFLMENLIGSLSPEQYREKSFLIFLRQIHQKVCKLIKTKGEAIKKNKKKKRKNRKDVSNNNTTSTITTTAAAGSSNSSISTTAIATNSNSNNSDNNMNALDSTHNSRIRNPYCSLYDIDQCFEAYGKMNLSFIFREDLTNTKSRNAIKPSMLQDCSTEMIMAMIGNPLVFNRGYLDDLTVQIIESIKLYKLEPSKGLAVFKALLDNHVDYTKKGSDDDQYTIEEFHAVFSKMEENDKIFDMLLDGIEHYCNSSKTNKNQVQAYCDLLTHLLQNSLYVISESYIEKLWQDTMPKYTDMWVTYLFIYSLSPDTFFGRDQNEEKKQRLLNIIFRQLCSIKNEFFSTRSFAAYKSYFCLINKANLEYQTTRTTKIQNLREPSAIFDATTVILTNLLNLKFEGLEKMWELIKFSADPNLNHDAKCFLIELYETENSEETFSLLETRTKLLSDVFVHLDLLQDTVRKEDVDIKMAGVDENVNDTNDNIANYTAITNLIDLLMLLMEKHEYGMGNKKFSHSITRNIDRKAFVKVGYITEFLNNSFSFDISTIPEIELYCFENINEVRKKILKVASEKGIIKNCFQRILKEDKINIPSWNEKDFILRYHKRTISSSLLGGTGDTGNIIGEYRFFTNDRHIEKDQLNLVFVQSKQEDDVIEIDQENDEGSVDLNMMNYNALNNNTSSTTTTTTSALKKIIRKPMIKRSETSYILSTSPFFEKLFSLLNHRYEAVVTKAWNLLQRACTSQDLLTKHYDNVGNLLNLVGNGDINGLQQNTTLLYTLEIVWKLIFTPDIMPSFPFVYMNEEKNTINFQKIDSWKRSFLNGGGLGAIETIVKKRLAALQNDVNIRESNYSIKLFHLSIEILQYFIEILLPASIYKKFPLAGSIDNINPAHQFYNEDHLYEIASIAVNVIHAYGITMLKKNRVYKGLVVGATSLLSSIYDLIVAKVVTVGEDGNSRKNGAHFIHKFLTADNFMKLMYVLHDCVERDIRQRIGIFLSHKVLKLESKEQKTESRCINIGLNADDILHFLNLAYPLIQTIDPRSNLAYEYLASFRNVSRNFNQILSSGDTGKSENIIHILADCEALFAKALLDNSYRAISDQYIFGLLSVIDIYLNLLQFICSSGVTLKSTGWKDTLSKLQSNMLNIVLFNFDQEAFCIPPESKKYAFSVLLWLWKLNENPKTKFSENDIHSKLLEIQGSDNVPQNQWQFSIDNEERDENVGYIGLYNQGSTCYMNSLLQQFFMIPQFRETILNCDELTKEDIELHNEVNKKEGKGKLKYGPQLIAFLYELKKMFAFLKHSPRKAYDPISFVNACRNKPDGFFMLDSDVFDQNDAGEFLSIFLDKLETSLKYAGIAKKKAQNKDNANNNSRSDGNASDFIKTCFYGEYAHQMIILDDNNRLKERTEPFYTLRLEVKNNANVETSLSTLIQDEILQGENSYYDDLLDKKVRAIKRLRIKRLPPVLVLQLKRFELNYDTFQKVKLNDKYVFPTLLDMQPYMSDADNNNSNQNMANGANNVTTVFKLSGILIHSGSANAGHYYSYIKDREKMKGTEEIFIQSKKGNYNISPANNWLKFNDDEVDNFDTKNIPQECYGGYAQRFPIVKNAFILFYEQENQLDDTSKENSSNGDTITNKINVDDGNKRRKLNNSNADSSDANSVTPNESYSEENVGIPSKIEEEIELDKINFRKLATLYDGYYASFLCNAIEKILIVDADESDEAADRRKFQLFELCTYYVFNILLYSNSKDVRQNDSKFLQFLMNTVKENYNINKWFLNWFLSKSTGKEKKNKCRIKLFLLKCTIVSSRVFVSQLLSSAVKAMINAAEFKFKRDDYISCSGGEYTNLSLADGDWVDDEHEDDEDDDEDYVGDGYGSEEEDSSSSSERNNWASHVDAERHENDNKRGTKNESIDNNKQTYTASDFEDSPPDVIVDSADDSNDSNEDDITNSIIKDITKKSGSSAQNDNMDDSAPSSDDNDDVNTFVKIASENALHGFANAVTQDGSDEGGKEDSKGDVPVRADQTLVGRFVSSWFNLLEESAISHWRRFPQYFYCLFDILYEGIMDKDKHRELYNVVHSQYAVARMINIYLNTQSPDDLLVLNSCMKNIPAMEYKNLNADIYPVLNLIALLSLTKRNVKFENERDESYPMNGWNEPKIDYYENFDNIVYAAYFTMRMDNVQVPYYSEDFLSAPEFLEKLSEDSLELVSKLKSDPRQSLPLNLLFLKAANNASNSFIIMKALLTIPALPFQFDDISRSLEVIKMLLFMKDNEKVERSISSREVRLHLFFKGSCLNPFGSPVRAHAFLHHIANYYNIYDTSCSFLENLKQMQNTPQKAIRENEGKVQYLKRLVLECYGFLDELYTCKGEPEFAQLLVEGLEELQVTYNNSQEYAATYTKIRKDLTTFIRGNNRNRGERENMDNNNNNNTSQQDGGRGNDRRKGSKGGKDGSNVVFV